MRLSPLRPAEPAYHGTFSPTRQMAAVLGALAIAVIVWPGSMHPQKRVDTASVQGAEAARPVSQQMTSPPLRSTTTGTWLPTESNWSEQLRRGDYWGKNAYKGSSWTQPRNGPTRANRTAIPWPETRSTPDFWDWDTPELDGAKTYRTMCVRLCDGFYWPVSYSVTRDRFDADANTCARSCGGADQAKLFVYRNPGSEIDDMEDLEGRAYKRLKTAFQFKTKFEASCKCRPNPWEDASKDRHQSYALAEQAQRGNKVAAAELRELRVKIRDDEKAAAKIKGAEAKDAKAAALASVRVRKGAASTDDELAMTPTATAAVSMSGPKIVRAPDKRSSTHRSARQPQAELADLDDDEPTTTVRMRFGGRTPVDVRVRSNRGRKAAEAGSQVVKQ